LAFLGNSLTINSLGTLYIDTFFSTSFDIGSGSPLLINNGFVLVVNNDSFAIHVPFTNNGNVTITLGTLVLAGGGSASGTFSALSSTILLVDNTYTFSSTVSGTGSLVLPSNAPSFSGTVSISTVNVDGGLPEFHSIVTVPTFLVSSGTASFTSSSTTTITDLTITSSGVVNVGSNSFTVNGGSLNSASASITGSGLLSFGNTFTWVTGTISVTTYILSSANVTLIYGVLSANLFINGNGTLTVNGGLSVLSGNIINYGLIDITAAGSFNTSSNTTVILNYGTLLVVLPTSGAEFSFNIPFWNYQNVMVTTGTLLLNFGSSGTGSFLMGVDGLCYVFLDLIFLRIC